MSKKDIRNAFFDDSDWEAFAQLFPDLSKEHRKAIHDITWAYLWAHEPIIRKDKSRRPVSHTGEFVGPVSLFRPKHIRAKRT